MAILTHRQIASSKDLENEFAAMAKAFEVSWLSFSTTSDEYFFRAGKPNTTGLLVNVRYNKYGECSREASIQDMQTSLCNASRTDLYRTL